MAYKKEKNPNRHKQPKPRLPVSILFFQLNGKYI
jgi:hypothetical protein